MKIGTGIDRKNGSDTESRIVNLVDVCRDVFGFSPARYHALVKEGVLPPPVSRGKIDFVEAAGAYVAWMNKRIETREREKGLRYEQARLLKVNADLLERELKERDENLLSRKDVAEAWEMIKFIITSRIRAFPAKVAIPVSKAKSMGEVKELLDQATREALTNIANTTYEQARAEYQKHQKENARPRSRGAKKQDAGRNANDRKKLC